MAALGYDTTKAACVRVCVLWVEQTSWPSIHLSPNTFIYLFPLWIKELLWR